MAFYSKDKLVFLLLMKMKYLYILKFIYHIDFYNTLFHFQVLYFVDDNGNEVLSLGSMVKVSEETIRNILCRESLSADEFVKFQVNLSPANIWDNYIPKRPHWCGAKTIVMKMLRNLERRWAGKSLFEKHEAIFIAFTCYYNELFS